MNQIYFTGSQWIGMIGIGSSLWLSGVIAIRSFPNLLFGDTFRQLASYAAVFPLIYSTLVGSEYILGLSIDQRLASTTVMSVTALFLDGSALMWFPELYENPELNKIKSPLALRHSRRGAAWLLWTFGAGFAMALYTHLK